MIPLSHAIRKGADIAPGPARVYFELDQPNLGFRAGSDPLGAAYLGHLHPGAVESFFNMVRAMDKDRLCAHMIRALHKAWPHLGSTVRAWPRLAEELERDRLIPRLRINQPEYRQEIHRSLWAVICDMHDAGSSKEEIATYLEGHGL